MKVWVMPGEFLAEDGDMWTGEWKKGDVGIIDSLTANRGNHDSSSSVYFLLYVCVYFIR